MLINKNIGFSIHPGQTHLVEFVLDNSRHTDNTILTCLQAGIYYETPSTLLTLRLLRPGDVFVDIGAHVGWYSLLAAKIVGTEGKVLAFEPNPSTYRSLVRHALINTPGVVTPIAMAISDCSGTAPFFVNDANEGESSLIAPGDNAKGESIAVATVSLDELEVGRTEQVKAKGLRLIKIDAEGAEPAILRGGGSFFEEQAPHFVICEINRGALYAAGSSERDIRTWFATRGYSAYMLNLTAVDLFDGHELKRLAPDEYIDTNFIFNICFAHQAHEQELIGCGSRILL